MNKNTNNLHLKSQAGFSLVDVMVGMVIALLGMIIIFQVFSVSEGIKRTTTSGGDALQNGASSLFTLERSLKVAGYGMSPGPIPPVAINPFGPVAANASDTIAISYTQTGKLAVVGAPCSVIPVTVNPNWDYGSFIPDGVIPPALTTETISVSVINNHAQLCSDVNGVISDGIALMKAEYGVDTTVPQDYAVDVWTQAPPVNMMTVLAVRIAVVARSAQPEKPSVVGGTCDTTTVFPTWIDSATVPLDLSAKLGLAAGDDWKCYRYKTFENTVSLRNVVWR